MACDGVTHSSNKPAWQDVARAKRASRDAAIPQDWILRTGQVTDGQLNVLGVPTECGIMTAREIEVTEVNAVELVQKLTAGEYSSYEVTMAFCKRAAIAQQLVNCLSKILFTSALKTAQDVDKEYAATGAVKGPLHGLPVSLKDCFQIEGTDAVIGLTAFVHHPATLCNESELTKVMRQCGAILFCKTNTPPALMAGETYNSVYGYTLNPYNRNCFSGGSSGGESALLALRGSPLGIGSDVGGSIRTPQHGSYQAKLELFHLTGNAGIPASFCGLYSLKPSFGRFSTSGLRDGFEGQEAVRNCVGPMATSLSAIEMWWKAALSKKSWLRDSDCLPIPWRHVQAPEKLCFGLLLDDGVVRPLPPVARALLQTKAALKASGHTVIDFSGCDLPRTEDLKYALYRSSAADAMSRVLAQTGEPWPRGYEMLEQMVSHDAWRASDNRAVTVTELWKAQSRRTDLATQILKIWAATESKSQTGREMDALLTPCTPWPACLKRDLPVWLK